MKVDNYISVEFPSKSANESFARSVVACFAAQMDPPLEELGDVRTAVSEAVTNCIVHAYKNTIGTVYITVRLCEGNLVRIEIKDKGCGIEDVETARQPLYTTDAANERSGMGFTVMESFCDKVRVFSGCKKGTTVTLYKYLKGRE